MDHPEKKTRYPWIQKWCVVEDDSMIKQLKLSAKTSVLFFPFPFDPRVNLFS